MLTTANIEDVTLSLPNGDLAMLRMLSQRMGWKLKTRRKSGLEKALEDVAAGRVYEAESLEELFDQLEAKSTTPPPCQYTEEEVVQRVKQATAEAESGVGCLTLDEFEALVETW